MKKILTALVVLAMAMPASAQMMNGRPGKALGGAKMLDTADTNGDGYITEAEFRTAREAHFKRMDRNNDGAVSRADFGRLARFKPEAVDRLMAMLSGADANDDGTITRAELSAAPMLIFSIGDTDGDGRLSRAEVQVIKDRAAERRR